MCMLGMEVQGCSGRHRSGRSHDTSSSRVWARRSGNNTSSGCGHSPAYGKPCPFWPVRHWFAIVRSRLSAMPMSLSNAVSRLQNLMLSMAWFTSVKAVTSTDALDANGHHHSTQVHTEMKRNVWLSMANGSRVTHRSPQACGSRCLPCAASYWYVTSVPHVMPCSWQPGPTAPGLRVGLFGGGTAPCLS